MLRQQIFRQPIPQHPAYIIKYKQQEKCARDPGRRVSAGTSGTVFPAKAAVFYKIGPHFPSFFQKKLLSGIFGTKISAAQTNFFLIKKNRSI
jgi:hypothetical protein